MINLNSISLGDWFRYRYTTCDTHREIVRTFRVTAIEKMTGWYYVWGVDQNGKSLGRICPPEKLEGIELTEEILEKNFPFVDGLAWWQQEDAFHCESCTNGDIMVSGQFRYVHQLQHALTLAGIEKEIEL